MPKPKGVNLLHSIHPVLAAERWILHCVSQNRARVARHDDMKKQTCP